MNVVFYDPNNGRITSTVTGSKTNIEAHDEPYIEVDAARDDYDTTHKVINEKLVPIKEPK